MATSAVGCLILTCLVGTGVRVEDQKSTYRFAGEVPGNLAEPATMVYSLAIRLTERNTLIHRLEQFKRSPSRPGKATGTVCDHPQTS